MHPRLHKLAVYLGLILALDLLFVVVYGGCNWLTGLRSERLHLYAPWELAIPFVSWMIVVYLSISILFVLPLFLLDEDRLERLAAEAAVATVAAGAIFLLLPADLGFARPASVPGFQPLFGTLYSLDLPHNLFPSLHVAYSTLILNELARASSRAAGWLYRAWLVAICSSTVLVHQHHLADVLGGLLLAFACSRTARPAQGDIA